MNKLLILICILVIILLIGCQNLGKKELLEPESNQNQVDVTEGIPGTLCKSIIPNHNKVDYDRMNFVFVGFNVNKNEFVDFLPKLVDYNGYGYKTSFDFNTKIKTEGGETIIIPPGVEKIFYGLFGTEPFKSNKDKFNFWYIDQIQEISVPLNPNKAENAPCNVLCRSNVEDSCNLKNAFIVNICNAECTPRASNEVFIGKPHPSQIRIMLHEFGHILGLKDEYTKEELSDLSGYPNCAPSMEIAQKWWGNLVGEGEGLLKVGYFQGCSYLERNIRPTEASLMSANQDLSFGPVNEIYIKEVLDNFSGEYSDNIEQRDIGEILNHIESTKYY